MNRRRILLVEDEANLRRTVTDLLKSEGYAVEGCGDGVKGQDWALNEIFDLIVLDVMLPSRSGFDVCRQLRKAGVSTPILMLTARSELNNKVQGFKAGADDYLTKPFEAQELQVRIEALLRRAPSAPGELLTEYQFGDVRVNLANAQVFRGGKTTPLSERECRLLRYLIGCKGEVVSRDELLQHVWGYNATTLTRTVDVHIAWLRQKIEADPGAPRVIVTAHGQGYRFVG